MAEHNMMGENLYTNDLLDLAPADMLIIPADWDEDINLTEKELQNDKRRITAHYSNLMKGNFKLVVTQKPKAKKLTKSGKPTELSRKVPELPWFIVADKPLAY